MTTDSFHETVSVDLLLNRPHEPGEINRILKKLGATLHYDVYSFERSDDVPDWQSESYIDMALFFGSEEVDAQETVDRIRIDYPLATIGSEYIDKFTEMTFQIAAAFEANVMLEDHDISSDKLVDHCTRLASQLMTNWGEEPGSRALVVMIEQSYA